MGGRYRHGNNRDGESTSTNQAPLNETTGEHMIQPGSTLVLECREENKEHISHVCRPLEATDL
ncbi:hypothetical protein SORBI_3003G223950 [Sorghum bicolor]|uniref:Uncharacterized protein n=1 Tax=Sorghum bicolor TaxID=4558 RepID=C5XR46_SORBI|nr:hypothetical protein SORBI_3003G223950 [Sorghum bicolor]